MDWLEEENLIAHRKEVHRCWRNTKDVLLLEGLFVKCRKYDQLLRTPFIGEQDEL